jgi:putative DNA primase/helicase
MPASPMPDTPDTNAQLDALFQEARAPSYQDIIGQAERLEKGDATGATEVLKSCIKAHLNDVHASVILKELNQSTKIGVTDLRGVLKQLRKSGLGAIEDLSEKIVRLALARFYMNGDFLTRGIDQRFMEYIGTHWIPRTDDQVAAKVQQVIRDSISPEAGSYSALLAGAMTWLKAHCTQDTDVFRYTEEPHPVINCRNHELWLSTTGEHVTRPHNPRSYLTYCLPFDFDPNAKCPLYDAAVRRMFENCAQPDEMVRHLNEILGYAIQPQRDIACFLMLKGDGANGKSKWVETMTRLVGPDAVASIRIDSLDSQFGMSTLLGKLIMVDDDVDAGTKLPDGVLKQISERKRVSIEFKGKTPFDATLTVLPVLLCNNFPVTSDVTRGMLRRVMVIGFDMEFIGANDDKALFPRIWMSEMSGVLNRAVEGYKRLRQRGAFDEPAACVTAREAWLGEANPLQTFLEECTRKAEPEEARNTTQMRLQLLYRVFQAWAEEAGVRHITARKKMKANLKALGFEVSISGGYSTLSHLKFSEYGLAIISQRNIIDR